MAHHLSFCLRIIVFLSCIVPHLLIASHPDLPNNKTKLYPASASCVPVSTATNEYINEIKFLGTLNADITNTSMFSGTGYADYSNLPQKAKQVPGGVINVNVSTSNAQGVILSTTKAWVDWNKDEIFDQTDTEKVYDISQIGALSSNVIFGFVVPLGTPAGFYKIRIRASGTDADFDACNTVNSGEAEDYTFEVVDECSVVITSVTSEKRCGSGSVILRATANTDNVTYQWYTSEFGNPITNQTQSVYTTPELGVGTHIYYVTAFNGLCVSTFRTPVKVVVAPTVEIQFMQSNPEICGPITSTVITTTADQEEITLLDENFDSNPINDQFENIYAGNTNADGRWQVRASPYVPQTPPYNVVKPAISSGYNGGNFANIITDVRQTTNILNHYTLKTPLNTNDVKDLKLEFDLYFFSEEDLEAKNYFVVQYSIDGANWIDLKKYIADVGISSRFQNEIINLPEICENQTNLKIRFSAFAFGSRNEWMADIVALDNIKLYGNKDVITNFNWSGNTGLFANDCSASPVAGGSPSICIKPTDQDNHTKPQFTITASAVLANGCGISRTITIPNNNKVWETETGENWFAPNWQPTPNAPDITKCVLVKKPLTIYNNGHAEAKNVKVAPNGTLNVKGNASLKIQDAFINEATENSVLIESGGNLLQVNDDINLNIGQITARKSLKISTERKQYNYLISPLEGQNLKTIYPGITFITAYNESTSYFSNSNGSYIKGRALAVKEPTVAAIPVEQTLVQSQFIGNVTNGAFSVHIVNSMSSNNSRGYNLVGNPYPSAIDLIKLYEINGAATGTLNSTFDFWDSSVNAVYAQQGSNYGGQSYGQFNALNGTGTPATGDLNTATNNIPTRYVQSGIGFMARSMVSGMDLKFQNYIRTNQPISSGALLKHSGENADRFWVSLISPTNVASTMGVVYFPGGDSGFSQDDTISLMGADAIFSLVEDKNISINGKSPFAQNDRVELGTAHFVNGSYQIKVVKKEGIFESAQKIYLKDKQTNIIADISDNAYSFNAQSGFSSGRFELVYQPEITLATDSSVKEEILIYREGFDFVIKSATKNINKIEIFDAVGRLLHQKSTNQKEVRFDATYFANGMYLLKIHQNGSVTTKKIIR